VSLFIISRPAMAVFDVGLDIFGPANLNLCFRHPRIGLKTLSKVLVLT
jgi:hypothetical protein